MLTPPWVLAPQEGSVFLLCRSALCLSCQGSSKSHCVLSPTTVLFMLVLVSKDILDSATEQWGIKVARVEIKDIRIPVAMQRTMAAEAEAAQEARAKVRSIDVYSQATTSHTFVLGVQVHPFLLIVKVAFPHYCQCCSAISISLTLQVVAAEGERNASKALKQASVVLADSTAGLQLRYLQTLTTLAAENNSTIVFPLPINMFENLGQKNRGG